MKQERISLPEPDRSGAMTVEAAIDRRRSRRSFRPDALSRAALGQLLWSMQGRTGGGALRAAPSAGATYPLEIFAAAGPGGVEGLEAGVYRYLSEDHEIVLHRPGDVRQALARSALNQLWVLQAPVCVVVAADFRRTTNRYGQRGIRYVLIEVGHAAGNLQLQAESLGLASVAVGAYRDEDAAAVLDIGPPLEILYIIPVGMSDG
jgi:SagB-type dehydrogenase family enzyme